MLFFLLIIWAAFCDIIAKTRLCGVPLPLHSSAALRNRLAPAPTILAAGTRSLHTMKIRTAAAVAALLSVCAVPLCAQAAYNDFLTFKLALYTAEDRAAIQHQIDEYQTKIEAAGYSEEEKLTLRTLLTVERADLTGKADAKQTYRLLTEQNERCNTFMAGKKDGEANEWLLVGWADVKSRLAGFVSGQAMYDEAARSRQLYTAALKRNKKFSQGHLSYGMWLFFAPPIAGGGVSAALKECSKAVSYAVTPEEKYFALLYRSQMYVADENEKKAAADLRAAHELFPQETFTQIVNEGNKNGKLFFE